MNINKLFLGQSSSVSPEAIAYINKFGIKIVEEKPSQVPYLVTLPNRGSFSPKTELYLDEETFLANVFYHPSTTSERHTTYFIKEQLMKIPKEQLPKKNQGPIQIQILDESWRSILQNIANQYNK